MKINYIIGLCISVALLAFLVYIAATRSIAHDEAFTYVYIVKGQAIRDILTFRIDIANNHILNSLSIMLVDRIFKVQSELYARLPNVLAFAIYLFSAFKICEYLFQSKKLQILSFLILVTNIFVFEFFGLARGYGLAIAFMTASIFSYLMYLKNNKTSAFYLILLCASLAVLANTVLLNFYIAMVFALAVYEFSKQKEDSILIAIRKTILKLVIPAFISATMLMPTVISIIKLKRRGGLWFGTSDFINGTVGSLIKNSFAFPITPTIFQILITLMIVLFIFMFFFTLYLFLKKKELNTGLFLLFSTLYITIASILAQFVLLKTPLLVGRTALFLIPLSVITLFIFISVIVKYKQMTNIINYSVIIISIFAIINFLVYAPNKCTLEWGYDCYDRNAFKYLSESGKRDVYVSWIYFPSISFYNEISDRKLVIHSIEGDKIDEADINGYVYYYNGKKEHKLHKLNLDQYNVVKEYDSEGVIMYKK